MYYCENNHEMDEDSKFCAICGAQSRLQNFKLDSVQAGSQASAIGRKVIMVMDLEPVRQSRASVIFRIVMVFPLLVLAYFVSIAVQVVTIVSWFSALFTKRIPEGIHKFVVGFLNMQANLTAYSFLLTAKWPGFNLSMTDKDQVKVYVAQGELNRAAVFFRAILGLPAFMLSTFVFGFGTWLMHFIMWITASFTGHTSRGLHQASSTILRLQTRTSAYFLLLTPEQPWTGLFGDRKSEEVAIDAPPAPPWEWALTKSARRWVAVTVIVGCLTYGGYLVLLGQILKAAAHQSSSKIETLYFCSDSTGSLEVTYEPTTCQDGSPALKQIIRLGAPSRLGVN